MQHEGMGEEEGAGIIGRKLGWRKDRKHVGKEGGCRMGHRETEGKDERRRK